ncbi:MAG: S-adenosylmethionine:tRNA ribosyltransferase-isomerase [Actinomycetota bacterium]
MIAAPATRFELPPDLSAAEPPEARGLARDAVRLLVVDPQGVRHARFHDIGDFLDPGDLLVVNTSRTLTAAVDGTRNDGVPVIVHFSTPRDDGTWIVELRNAPRAATPVLDAGRGERIKLPGGASMTLLSPAGAPSERGVRLWNAAIICCDDVASFLVRHGRPIAYGYVGRRWPTEAYQTVFATEPGSAEMPSAARPFSTELVTRLVSSGIVIAPVLLHTGISSLETDEAPSPERFRVPPATARFVNWTHEAGGRVIAVGTTVTRALESAARPVGMVGAAEGWTDLVLGPGRPARVVDGLITGMHAPDASHLLLLEAVAGPDLVQRAYDAALERSYLWHEFGDVCLFLPA